MNLSKADFGGIVKLHEIAYGTKSKPVFKIPYYQRPYEWDKEHIDNLIGDYIKNKTTGTSYEYFIGAAVLVKNIREELEVVDGQQRVTTMYLLNYLRFVLSKALVEYDLMFSGYITQASKDLDKLKEQYIELIGNAHTSEIEKMIKDVNKKISNSTSSYMKGDAKSAEKEIKSALSLYRKCMGMSEKDSRDEEFMVDSIQKSKDFWDNEELALNYSRKKFNDKLKEALANIVCVLDSLGKPIFINEENVKKIKNDDEIVGQYVEAVYYEYNNILKIIEDEGATEREITVGMIELIEEMLEKIEFCAVVTGSEKDAYALFESLNDRNKAVDDLDLIKNLYLRAYYNKSGDSPTQLEAGLSEIDHIWNNGIFTKDNRQNMSLFGAVYLTGDINLDEKNGLGVRKSIDAYLESFSTYSIDDVCNDIRTYKLIREILNKTSITGYNLNKSLLIAENNKSLSITFKCIYLIRALKYTNVLTGLINVIVRTYIEQNPGNIDVTDFRNNFLDGLELASNHKDPRYEKINEIAYDLWRVCIMSENYEYPREYATQLINNFNKNTYNVSGASLTTTLFDNTKKQFNNWLPAWRYSIAAKDIRLKVLLIRLLQSEKDDTKNELILNSATAIVLSKPENAELDHLEPDKPDTSFSNSLFFQPPAGKTRAEIVDGLGNFMILDDYHNIKKSNCPLFKSMDYYDEMLAGKNHWLVDEVKNDLSSGKNFDTIASGDKVPKEEFFIERRNRLIAYFDAIVNASTFDTSSVKY